MVEGRPGSAPSQPSQGHLLQGTFPLEATLPWASSAPLHAPPAAAPQPQPPCPRRLLLQSAHLSGGATRTPRAPAVSLSLGQCLPRNHTGPGLMWRFQGEWGPNQPQQGRGDEERPCRPTNLPGPSAPGFQLLLVLSLPPHCPHRTAFTEQPKARE